jgi:hypothetical protein
VAMTAHMLNGGPGTAAPDACGAMTSGEASTCVNGVLTDLRHQWFVRSSSLH